MKLWHIVFAVALTALCLAIGRDPIGRVALVVFFTGIGVVGLATASLLLLFRSIAAIGLAQTKASTIEACVTAAAVLFFGIASMLFVLWCGMGLLSQFHLPR
jgi:hypothetical protein